MTDLAEYLRLAFDGLFGLEHDKKLLAELRRRHRHRLERRLGPVDRRKEARPDVPDRRQLDAAAHAFRHKKRPAPQLD